VASILPFFLDLDLLSSPVYVLHGVFFHIVHPMLSHNMLFTSCLPEHSTTFTALICARGAYSDNARAPTMTLVV
jgi:hypothetical protein